MFESELSYYKPDDLEVLCITIQCSSCVINILCLLNIRML